MHADDPEARGAAGIGREPALRLRVEAVAAEVATVRHAVVALAEARGIASELREDIALAVSEACTNVVMHAYRDRHGPGPLTVEAYLADRHFVVVVADQGTGMAPRTDSPGLGVGLGLIGRLAQHTEIAGSDPAGTTVTMSFAVVS
jgi:serine/threonine-protein kinase RsbW